MKESARKRSICAESYRNEEEKANLLYWQLTCEAFCSPEEWEWWFEKTGYSVTTVLSILNETKAAILVEQKKDLVVDEIEVPKLETGKVLVEIKSPVYADHNWEKLTVLARSLSPTPGHEAGGIVLDVGTGVTRLKVGDHFVCHWRLSLAFPVMSLL